MYPIVLPSQFSGDQRAEQIAEYRRHIERTRHFAFVAYVTLKQAFPNVEHSTLEMLRTAWVELQCGHLQERITFLEAQPADEEYRPRPETLIKLIEQRDQITHQLEQMRIAQEKMEEVTPGLREMMEATAVPMLRTQLDMIEGQISFVQKQLEAAQESPRGVTGVGGGSPDASQS